MFFANTHVILYQMRLETGTVLILGTIKDHISHKQDYT